MGPVSRSSRASKRWAMTREKKRVGLSVVMDDLYGRRKRRG
jgi:hypothetical protein